MKVSSSSSLRRGGIALCLAVLPACARTASVPDPRDAAEAWAAAVDKATDDKNPDSGDLYDLLSKRSRATMTKTQVAAIAKDDKGELREQAKGIREVVAQDKAQKPTEAPKIVAVALVRYEDGSEASLVLENGLFRVQNAILMPGGGATPEEAVASFRDALRRRSYPAIVRLLTPTLRATVEAQLKGLEASMAEPDKLPFPSGAVDEIDLKLENGHRVRLKRVNGKWYVDNFE